MEASAQAWAETAFHLDRPQPLIGPLQQQVDLGAGGGAVKPAPASIRRQVQQGFDHEALPAGARHRMAQHRLGIVQTQEGVHQAAVAHQHLGRAHQPLAHVGVKRRQPPHQ